jgi:SpoIIAA-like
MFEKMSESAGNTIGFRVSGHVTKEDYAALTPEVQALVDREGSIGLLLDMENFKWEEANAWGADMKFGQTYRHKIAKLAIVGDKKWQHLIANLADPFYAHESKFFHTADRAAAWEWLRAK